MNEADNLERQLTFDYYKQQREEMAALGEERAKLSLQYLFILATLAIGFFEFDTKLLRLVIAGLTLALGTVGLLLSINIEKLRQLHMVRARAARQSLGFLEQLASRGGKGR